MAAAVPTIRVRELCMFRAYGYKTTSTVEGLSEEGAEKRMLADHDHDEQDSKDCAKYLRSPTASRVFSGLPSAEQ
jgi:hypothetical protein